MTSPARTLLVWLLALALSPLLNHRDARAGEPRIEAMSLEDKIGQMLLLAFKGPTLGPDIQEMIARRRIGGVILYSSWGNVEGPAQVAALTAALQAEAARTPQGVGLFVGIDHEGGPVMRIREGVTVFPSQMAVAATGNREHARAMARVSAGELAVLGVNMTFSPVADVNSNPDNPVINIRSFGSDPNVASRLTAAMTEEFVRARMLCTPKHFPGHGDTDVDSHQGLPVSNHDRTTLDRVDFAPFRAAIQAKAPAIMTAHMEVPALDPAPGVPATLSSRILEGSLRKELRFDGLIVTDSLGMGALSKSVGTVRAAVLAAKAGADVLLFGADIGHEPPQQAEAYEALLAAARSGELPMARIDQAVGRILAAKKAYGILEAGAIPDRGALIPYRVGIPDNIQAAQAVAQDSVTLRHDRLKLLPFRKGERILFVWPERTSFDPLASLALPEGAVLLRPAREPSQQDLQRIVEAAMKADKVVACSYDAVRNPAQRNMVNTLLSLKPQSIIHVALGGPYDLSLFPQAPAAVATYGDVPVSVEALSKALAGSIPFTGRLPVRLP